MGDETGLWFYETWCYLDYNQFSVGSSAIEEYH